MNYFYQPAEDSFFLAEITKKYIKKINKKKLNQQNQINKIKAFDMGTGSGIQSKNLISLKIPKNNITAVDINPTALHEAKKLGIKVIKSNLFQNIKEKYNLIIFNPPYLPENKYDKKPDTTGGKNGDETIIKFIKTLKPHLDKNGTALLLTSSQTPEKHWQAEAKKQKLKVKKLATKKLFFEELYIWEISA